MSGMFSVQNRARALDNNMYVIGMNLGTYYLDKDSTTPIDTFSGGSQIVDYRGQIVTEVPYGAGSTWIGGTIDIEALRHFRQTAQWDNWMKDLTTEQYQLIYEQPIYPKNLYLERAPYTHAEYREQVTRRQVELLQERGSGRAGAPPGVLESSSGWLGRCPADRAEPARDERAAAVGQRLLAGAGQAVRLGAPAAAGRICARWATPRRTPRSWASGSST